MNEGSILKDYIERQRISKTEIARELEMTRGNLYQLFDSKTLSPETKKKFSDYFKLDIFTSYTPAQVQNDCPPDDPRDKTIHSLEKQLVLQERQIAFLEDQVAELKRRNEGLAHHVNLSFQEVQKIQKIVLAYQKTQLHIQARCLSIQEKKTLEKTLSETSKLLAENLAGAS